LTPDHQPAVAAALALHGALAGSGERRLLALEGTAEWGLAAAAAIAVALAPTRTTWITDRPPAGVPDAIPPAKATALLGGECGLLIINAHGGLDADALGAAAGTLAGGGLLLLPCPPLADWPALPDPQAARISVHGHAATAAGHRFIGRLTRLLAASPAVVRVRQDVVGPAPSDTNRLAPLEPSRPAAAPTTAVGVGAASSRDEPATPDQQRAVEALCHLAAGRARRPLVLTADRGRGKSAALGIAAARLLAEAPRTILVTAPRRAAAAALFDHADRICVSGTDTPHRCARGGADRMSALHEAAALRSRQEKLRFVPPDALLRERPAADLLLVDEAAGIPAPLLAGLLEHYGRIAFATTVHGYEGTGRGFDVRFRAVLDRRTPGWRELRLDRPIRWAAGDPLEALIDRALLLDAEPAADAVVTGIIGATGAGPAAIVRLDRDRLAADEALLRQVFGLLVLGHYQTRPADLRLMLDAPNLEVFTVTARVGTNTASGAPALPGAAVLATALVAREGRLGEDLLDPIFDGCRRPHGHLLPQTLSAHAGLFDAPRLGHARILRIAVHPAARRQGLGRRLVNAVAARARADGLDLLGASFGATPDLIRFWHRCGLEPVHLGTHRNAASGAHAAVVLEPTSAAGRTLFDEARHRLLPRLAVQLAGPLRDLEPAIAAALLAGLPTTALPPDPAERRELAAFANAHRGLDAALPALYRLALHRLPPALAAGRLTPDQAAAIIACVLQGREPAAAARHLGLVGRAELERVLREAAGRL
jgi:tRNA(Met) cytidine acetyltransferase